MYFKHPVSYSGIYISVSSNLEACLDNNTLNKTVAVRQKVLIESSVSSGRNFVSKKRNFHSLPEKV